MAQAAKFGNIIALATRRTETKFDTQELMGAITRCTLCEILRRGWPENNNNKRKNSVVGEVNLDPIF